jgi:hypothetical protein
MAQVVERLPTSTRPRVQIPVQLNKQNSILGSKGLLCTFSVSGIMTGNTGYNGLQEQM